MNAFHRLYTRARQPRQQPRFPGGFQPRGPVRPTRPTQMYGPNYGQQQQRYQRRDGSPGRYSPSRRRCSWCNGNHDVLDCFKLLNEMSRREKLKKQGQQVPQSRGKATLKALPAPEDVYEEPENRS